MGRRILCLSAAILLAAIGEAAAQDVPPEKLPIGRFAADARVAFPKFKDDPSIAAGIGVTVPNLPARAFGLVFGAHWYPARLGVMTFGIGGEVMVARRGRTLETGTEEAPVKTSVNSRFSALSPQVSFNFGARDGWSYISGGLGWSTFTAERTDAPLPDPESPSKTINYGGGARWFAKKRLALSVDLRFYAVNPRETTATRPGLPRMTLMAFNVGAAFR
jgi:hypothetical protein